MRRYLGYIGNEVAGQPPVNPLVAEINRISDDEYEVISISGPTNVDLEIEDDQNTNMVTAINNVNLPYIISLTGNGYNASDVLRVRSREIGGDWQEWVIDWAVDGILQAQNTNMQLGNELEYIWRPTYQDDFARYVAQGNGGNDTNSFLISYESGATGINLKGTERADRRLLSDDTLNKISTYTVELINNNNGTYTVNQNLNGNQRTDSADDNMIPQNSTYLFTLGAQSDLSRSSQSKIYYLKNGTEIFKMKEGSGIITTGSEGTILEVKSGNWVRA